MARIGMVSIWFHRGQSEVTRTLRQALIDNGHEVFVFARMGGVYGMEKQEKDDPYWQLPNLTYFPRYEIPENALKLWAKGNKLDAVVFNEEYDFNLPYAIQSLGMKTIHYVDFIRDDWVNGLRQLYDQLWSATGRTSFMLQDMGLGDTLHHIGWGIHASTPYYGNQQPEYDFFHNAGWLGINFRKGTDLVLQAYSELINRTGKPYSLLVHAQLPIQVMVDAGVMTQELVDNLDPQYLDWRCVTVPPPGLYHLGKVVVQPSRLEGLGLTIPEGLWQGRTVLTTDAPPMNEFVCCQNNRIPYATQTRRSDGLSFPECVADVSKLARAMELSLPSWDLHGGLCRTEALNRFSWFAFSQRIAAGLAKLSV